MLRVKEREIVKQWLPDTTLHAHLVARMARQQLKHC